MYEVGDKKYYLKILGWYVSYDSMTGNITPNFMENQCTFLHPIRNRRVTETSNISTNQLRKMQGGGSGLIENSKRLWTSCNGK